MPPHRQRRRRACVTLTLCVIAALSIALIHSPAQPEPAPPREVEIRLTNGQLIRGVLVDSNDDRLQIRIGKILTTIERSDIGEMKMLPTFDEQYAKLRGAIANSDIPSLFRVVDWLIQHDRRDLAVAELDAIIARYPNNTKAPLIRNQILAQINLLNAAEDPAGRTSEPKKDDPNQYFPLLTPADINVIKVFEIDAENPPKIEISRATIEKLMTQYAGHPRIPAVHEQREALLRLPSEEILKLMFELRARDLYSEVKVLGHPESIRRFKTDVHRPWLQTRCVQCHNITSESKLRLFDHGARANSDQAVYTNFLILDRFTTLDGSKLIDSENPERSPLLQIALARQNSVFPHPEVIDPATGRDLFTPAFRTTKERRFRQAVQWVESLYRPRVDYPVTLPEIPTLDQIAEMNKTGGNGENQPDPGNPPKESGGGEH